MHDPSPRLDAVLGLPARRRLTLAVGTTLVCGVIAATIAQEQTAVRDLGAVPAPKPPAATAPEPRRSEPSRPAAVVARPAPSPDAVERLRVSVDLYLDARAVALRRLDEARHADVDPEVLSAMGAVLGMPSQPSAPTSATKPDDGPREL